MVGLASRNPLVDLDVVELVLKLPPELAFDPRWSRPLLRESTAGLVPDEVRLRTTKPSFDPMFHAMLAGTDFSLVRGLLGEGAEVGRYVHLDEVGSALLGGPTPLAPGGVARWANNVWRLLMLDCWLRAQADAAFLERLSTNPGLASLEHAFIEQ